MLTNESLCFSTDMCMRISLVGFSASSMSRGYFTLLCNEGVETTVFSTTLESHRIASACTLSKSCFEALGGYCG